jgi:hypothetical protein
MLSVYDQSVTGVVTGSPLSQRPGSLQARDRLNGGQSSGSKPKTRAATNSKTKQTNIEPPILNMSFIVYLPNRKGVLSQPHGGDQVFPSGLHNGR